MSRYKRLRTQTRENIIRLWKEILFIHRSRTRDIRRDFIQSEAIIDLFGFQAELIHRTLPPDESAEMLKRIRRTVNQMGDEMRELRNEDDPWWPR